jgi:hypothetical protein
MQTLMVKELEDNAKERETSLDKEFGFLPIPRQLRYQPNQAFRFGLFLNAFFGIVSTFSKS